MSETNAQMQWISVADRLPRNGQRVLVCLRGFLWQAECEITKFRLTSEGPAWDCTAHDWMLPSLMAFHVTHWMPLPDPPPRKP